jgi:hypothetical protein
MDFVPLDRSLFRRSLAESLCALLSQRYPTAKQIARAIGIEPVTAENMRRGKLSVGTLEKALLAEGRELWNRLGDEIFGETFYDYEERRIQAAIREAESARSNLVRLRTQGEELFSRADRLVQAGAGQAAQQHWDSAGGTRAEAHDGSADGTRQTRGRTDRRLAHRDKRPRKTGG